MKKLSKILSVFVFGVGTGAIIEMFFTILVGDLVVGTPIFITKHSLVFVKVIQTILYGGFGVVSEIASEVYKRTNLSIFMRTSLHILTILIYFAFAGYYLKWFIDLSSAIASFVIFLIMYLIIWSIIYFTEKRKVEKINSKLRSMK